KRSPGDHLRQVAALLMAIGLAVACSGPGSEGTARGAPAEPPPGTGPAEPVRSAALAPVASAPTPEPDRVRVGIVARESQIGALFVGQDNGIFQQHGLQLELQELAPNTIPPALQA